MTYIYKPELKDYVLGADWSKWNDINSTPEMVDFEQALNEGIRYSFIKSSQRTWADEDILMNWKNAKSAGMPRSAYHFMTFDYDPRKQAEYMWSLIEKDPGEIPPVCDFEYWLTTPPENSEDMLWNFVERLRVLSGKYPIIYTGAFFWKSFGSNSNAWKNFPLWIAAYTTSEQYVNDKVKELTPWDDWSVWQFTDNGDGIKYGGESYKLDLNWAKKDFISQFIDLDGTIPEPEPEPIDPPVEPGDGDCGKIKFEVLTDTLNIRSEPKVLSSTYTGRKLSKGDIVELDSSYAPWENWIYDENIGWVAEKHGGVQYLKRVE